MFCLPVCIYKHHTVCSAWGDQKGELSPLELELQMLWAALWVLGTKAGSFGRTLIHRAIIQPTVHFQTCMDISITVCFLEINGLFKIQYKEIIFKKCDKLYFCQSFVSHSQLLLHIPKDKGTCWNSWNVCEGWSYIGYTIKFVCYKYILLYWFLI